ncbi:kinase-like domain-containing protein [Microdochium trichocladiopsis]|uniref:non-specific serine/threonine protein kinase n=1 Tax=Microdochium trichocladiopsis TaxID=1682393 RepID=A0A9P8XXF0_9PEZI|nr:kinase-like domain-containing protein [Microdochium trichocladiopsis]KAH7021152.1 kinase-like domain-containing protein [Microdochium trichocladiopsis]
MDHYHPQYSFEPNQLPPLRTASSTPSSSPGLFSPTRNNGQATDSPHGLGPGSPYLHPLQTHKVRETHKALVDLDMMTGRKIINQYEVIEEIGRGMHGKVKLARNLETGENVAIKIIPRFSKTRRLGKVTASPQDKTKKEIAILKKIRHPNVVALLEIIDDPELKKIYMVLEHVELGEVVWRTKGDPMICHLERKRIEREMLGDPFTEDDEQAYQYMTRKETIRRLKKAKLQKNQQEENWLWSSELGGAHEDDTEGPSEGSGGDSWDHRRALTQALSSSYTSLSRVRNMSRPASRGASRSSTPVPSEPDMSPFDADDEGDMETPGPLPLRSQPGSSNALHSGQFGSFTSSIRDDPWFRGRSPSVADSIISHMSSVDFNTHQPHDFFADDFSYVPCFTFDKARAVFRDTLLGLEYLHYEGVVHRDIKPANLLWSKDHRVKISDFGVSYFGRPIRDEESGELVPESEACDFDDDLELAKTVGTPAFFAPELCYTDIDEKQPRISEQIDIWSLGVTLYCLIYARIPFLAEDEFQMFKKIAKEPVLIPRRRLKPVNTQHSPSSTSFYHSGNRGEFRDDSSPTYEDVDEDLQDLLRRMLTKDPLKRIRLREVKHHRWVTRDIDDVIAWLDDTDPSRRTAGRKIQVDEREMTRAVVPLTFLERARSVLKKTMDKVIPSSSQTRRRATSSAASSNGENTPYSPALPALLRDSRRKSIRPDDYFATLRESDHPLSQSVTVSPQVTPLDEQGYPADWASSENGDLRRSGSGAASSFTAQSDFGSRQPSTASLAATKPYEQRHERTRSTPHQFLPLTAASRPSQTTPATPAVENYKGDDPMATLRKARDIRPFAESARARSVDRGVFASEDKRAEAKVSLSTVVAPGNVELPQRPMSVAPIETRQRVHEVRPPQHAMQNYQHRLPGSDPNIYHKQNHAATNSQDEQQITPQRVMMMETVTPPPRVYKPSTAASFAQAQRKGIERTWREEELARRLQQHETPLKESVNASAVPCPPSPDDELDFGPFVVSTKRRTSSGVASGSSMSLGALTSSMTSPCDSTISPGLTNYPGQSHDSPVFRSDPSLPALLSGASSVSADAEGEFLVHPGQVDRASLVDTTDSLTPPAMCKEPLGEFPLEGFDDDHHTVLFQSPQVRGKAPTSAAALPSRAIEDEDEDDSDSDEGIVMFKSKRKGPPKELAISRRRDTQTSVGSTETAKKILMQSR